MRATRRGQPCSEGEATARVLCSSAPRQPVGDDALPGRPLRAPGRSRPGRQPVSGAPVSTVYVAVSSQSRATAGSALRAGLPLRFPRSLASRWRGHAGSGRERRGLRGTQGLHVARECAFRDRCGERRNTLSPAPASRQPRGLHGRPLRPGLAPPSTEDARVQVKQRPHAQPEASRVLAVRSAGRGKGPAASNLGRVSLTRRLTLPTREMGLFNKTGRGALCKLGHELAILITFSSPASLFPKGLESAG